MTVALKVSKKAVTLRHLCYNSCSQDLKEGCGVATIDWSVEQAKVSVAGIGADMGGTDIYNPLEQILKVIHHHFHHLQSSPSSGLPSPVRDDAPGVCPH